MKIIISTASFKDVYTPIEISSILKKIVVKILDDDKTKVENFPMADGGEYTTEIFKFYSKTKVSEKYISGIINPLGKKTKVRFLDLGGKIAFIASFDIVRINPKSSSKLKNPLFLTSYGLGQAVDHLVKIGYKEIIIGLGGTSIADGGIGLMQALGVKFDYDKNCYLTNKDIPKIKKISVDKMILKRFSKIKFTALCDGDINLEEMEIPTLQKIGDFYKNQEKNKIKKEILNNINFFARKLYNKNILNKKFYGAAGGVLLGMNKICKIKKEYGADYLLKRFNIINEFKEADLIITAEGKFDNSLHGKAPIAICKKALKAGIPTLYLCGDIDQKFKSKFLDFSCHNLPNEFKKTGITYMISLHNFYDNILLPFNYYEKIKFYKKITKK